MATSTPTPRRPDPRPAAAARRPGSAPARTTSAATTGRRRRIRWGRIPGRLILALCFVVGVAALAAVVLPFSSTNDDGVDLRCGPAVFEVLMPADPAFDDIPENAGCAAPAKTRLIAAGAAMGGVLVVAAITERRTRRGSIRRDTRWLSSSTRRRRTARRTPKPRSGAAPPTAVGRGAGSTRSGPT